MRLRRGRPVIVVETYPVLQPSASWSGSDAANLKDATVTGLDNIAPTALDTSLKGVTGWAQPALFHTTIWDYRRFSEDEELIVIGGYTADPSRAGVDHVIGYLEGGTATSYTPIWDETWGWGYPFLVRQRSGKSGLARLVFDIVPFNGYINRTRYPMSTPEDPVYGWPVILDNPSSPLTRDTKYLDPVSGNDTTGTGAIGAPWKSLKKAVTQVTDDMLIWCAPGTTNEDTTTWSSTYVTDLICPAEFKVSGARASCIIGKNLHPESPTFDFRSLGGVHDNGELQINVNMVKFNGLWFDWSQYITFWLPTSQLADPLIIFENCDHIDSLSDQGEGTERIGPVGGYINNDGTSDFKASDGQRFVAYNCTYFCIQGSSTSHYVNCTMTVGRDAMQPQAWTKGLGGHMVNTRVNFLEPFKGRYTTNLTETATSWTPSGSDCLITLNGSATVWPQSLTAVNGDIVCQFTSGALASINENVNLGPGCFYLREAVTATKVLRVHDPSGTVNANLTTGTLIHPWSVLHPDQFQLAQNNGAAGQIGHRLTATDFAIVNSPLSGEGYQSWFLSPRGLSGTVSPAVSYGTVATSGTTFTLAGLTKTVASGGLSYSGGTGHTTITWNETTQTFPITADAQALTPLEFLTGPQTGTRYRIYSQTNTTTVVIGDLVTAGVVAGNTAAPYVLNVNDALTDLKAGSTQHQYRHVVSMSGPLTGTLDAAFTSDLTTRATIAEWGFGKGFCNGVIALNTVQPVTSSHSAHINGNMVNWLIAQNTQLQNFSFASATGGTDPLTRMFAVKGVTILDNVFTSLVRVNTFNEGEAGYGPRGMVYDNNTILSEPFGTMSGSNRTTEASATFDADGRPTSGLTNIMTASSSTGVPQIPFAADGEPLTDESLVGALQPT